MGNLEEYCFYIDSDYEDVSSGVKGEPPEAEEERENQTRAVFVKGLFSTYVHFGCYCLANGNNGFPSWKSLLFYLCTGTITFAPLRSQGIELRSDYIRSNTTAAAPPPCSPKSLYVLAGEVGQPSIVGELEACH